MSTTARWGLCTAAALAAGACGPAEAGGRDASCVVGWCVCPEGFSPSIDGPGCDPVLPESCPTGTMPRFGATDCTLVGWTGCGEGFAWDEGLASCDAVVPRVACAGATMEVLGAHTCQPVGDCDAPFPPPGSHAVVRPGGSIQRALDAAPEGAVIGVAAGTYRESLRFNRAVTLAGECAERVHIAGDGSDPGLLVAALPDVVVRGVTLRGHTPGIAVTRGGRLDGLDLVVEANHEVGISVQSGAAATFTGVVVRGTHPAGPPIAGLDGVGIDVSGGARLTLARVSIVENHTVALGLLDPGTTVEVDGLVVRDTQPQVADRKRGQGITVTRGATLVLRRALLSANHEAGLVAIRDNGPPTRVEASDLVVAGTEADEAQREFGMGVVAHDAEVALTRVLLVGNRTFGLLALGGARVDMREGVVRDTRPRAVDDAAGLGVSAEAASVLTLSRVLVASNHAVGLGIGDDVRAIATDLAVADTRARGSDHAVGAGVAVYEGGHLELTGAHLTANRDAGLLVWSPGSRLEARDVVVYDTRPTSRDAVDGVGAAAWRGGRLVLTRALLSANHAAGITCDGAVVEASDVVVRDTRPPPGMPVGGWGLIASRGAAIDLSGALLAHNRTQGLDAAFSGTRVTARRVVVRDTAAEAPGGVYGDGVAVTQDAEATLEDTLVQDNARVGLVVMFGAGARATGGVVTRNLIGVNTGDRVELGRDVVLTDTRVEGNRHDFDTLVLSLPELPPAPAGQE